MEIARSYAAQHRRIRICENEKFLDAVANHNASLRQISPVSKYCKLVFADDWIFPECIERMVAVAEKYPSIGIVGAYVLQGNEVKCEGLPYQASVFDGREICRRTFLDRLYVFESANAVLYRADLVRERPVFYDEGNIHGDNEVCFTLLKTSDFGFVHQILSYTRVRSESRSTFSADFHTYFPGMLQLLLSHGLDYLTRDERDGLVRQHLSEYYRFLGKCLLLGRVSVLDYHRAKLNEAGLRFHWSRVGLGMLATISGLALNPKSSAEQVLKAWGRPTSSADRKSERSSFVSNSATEKHEGK
jgi:GT2 family glycosyltransferase